jgi:hypothetical protein
LLAVTGGIFPGLFTAGLDGGKLPGQKSGNGPALAAFLGTQAGSRGQRQGDAQGAEKKGNCCWQTIP